jgi:hypothetical protein
VRRRLRFIQNIDRRNEKDK